MGKPPFLTPAQQERLVAEAATGVFGTAQAVRDWLEEQFGVVYAVGSLYTLLPRLGIGWEGPPAPPPERRPPGPNGLEKGGLRERLKAAGPRRGRGSCGATGCAWGCAAGCAGSGRRAARRCRRRCRWLEVHVRGGGHRPVDGSAVVGLAEEHEGGGNGPHLGAWAEDPDIDGWVWDGAGGHKGEDMQAVDAPQVVQPPHAPS